jgi:hypothetical protein
MRGSVEKNSRRRELYRKMTVVDRAAPPWKISCARRPAMLSVLDPGAAKQPVAGPEPYTVLPVSALGSLPRMKMDRAALEFYSAQG